MPLNLLLTVQQVYDELGLTRPNSVIGNSDQQVRQMLAFTNKVGRDLVRDFEWRRIIRENIFETTASRGGTALVSSANTLTGFSSASSLAATGDVVTGSGIPQWAEVTVVTETQLTLNVRCTGSASATTSCTFARQYYDLPADFDRQVSRTQWDRSDHRIMYGQKSPQLWQWLKGGIVTSAPYYRYRLRGNRMQISPVPGSRLVLANEYISSRWISSSTAADPTLSTYAADTDLSVFLDDVMVNGIKFHFLKAKGLEFAVELGEFNRSLSYAKGQDTPAENLSLAPEPADILIGQINIPDSNIAL
ncbi:MAG: hypothetical protein NUV51_03905 [Sulfuricaulis sp.]|nr:hypothetical protein [Sulfuricaulis sp.]